MGMLPFILFFPEVAKRETLSLRVRDVTDPPDPRRLPADEYAFPELYCVDPGCDCRRVMLNVVCRSRQVHVATINHAFEPPTKEWDAPEQTFLDPLNVQSELSSRLLETSVFIGGSFFLTAWRVLVAAAARSPIT